jgi:cytochrome P450
MPKPENCPVADIDPYSREFLADPYAHHEKLRELGPVVWFEPYDLLGMARYQHVWDALGDHETYCSGRGVGLTDFAREEPWRPPSLILEADPPLHTRTRGVLAKALSTQNLSAYSQGMKKQADGLVTALLNETVDAIPGIAEAYPLKVFPDVVGLAEQGRENLLPYGNMAFNAFGPRNEMFEEAFRNAQPVTEWIAEQCQRDALAPDRIGAQIYEAVDEGTVSEEEAGLLVRSILTAGLDTTVMGIGALLYCFATNPDQWQALRANPQLARNAYNETLRYLGPAQTFARTTTRAVEVEGIEIPEGQKVSLFLAAANRDPRRWEAPDRFDIQRKAAGHVGFGHGIHVCVGQMLARFETQALLSSLVEQVRAIELAGDPEWRINNALHGLGRLPLRLISA